MMVMGSHVLRCRVEGQNGGHERCDSEIGGAKTFEQELVASVNRMTTIDRR